MKHYILHLTAGNDRNGNPRRLFVVFDVEGTRVDAIDEEFYGHGAVSAKYPDAVFLSGCYATTLAEYKELLRLARNRR